ncbi:MAG: ECF transporter S component [Deltaproteobacteria bacterium]|jgi:energy-coupling factor transport system substrate-specific component|nr:ECF transporter S component [Deltaproteobacteria bacterium]
MFKLKESFEPWKLREALLVGIVSVVFGVVYVAVTYLSVFLATLISFTGLGLLVYEPIYGVWFMASTFIAYFIRKPGAAIMAEVLAAFLEVLMGNVFGPLVLLSAALQGLGAELVFLAYDYKNYSLKVMILASLASGLVSFGLGFFISGFTLLSFGLILVMLAIRLISSAFFAGYLSYFLAVRLEKTGLTKGYGHRAS